MNTNQIMPMAGKVQVSRKMATANKPVTGSKNGSFDDVLAKSKGDSLTLQDVKDLAKDTETVDKETKLTEAVESVGKEADAPKENKSDAKNSEKISEKNEEVTDLSVKADEASIAEAVMGAVILDALKTTLNDELAQDIPDEANESLKLGDTVKIANAVKFDGSVKSLKIDIKTEMTGLIPKEATNNLQTILPQSNELVNKGREMLAMLSGQYMPKQEGNIDISGFEPIKNQPFNLGNANMPLSVQEKPLDPLSLLASEMAKVAKLTENGASEVSLEVPLKGPVQNLADTKIVDNVKNLVNDKLQDLGINKNVVEVDIKVQTDAANTQEIIQPNAKNLEAKVQSAPVTPQAISVKTENISQNPLSDITVEVDDVDALPIRQVNSFGQNANNTNNDGQQSLFNRGQEEIIQPDSNWKNDNKPVGSVENNQTFSQTLETQNNTQNISSARESTPTTALVRDDFNVRGQIVEQARLIRAENGTEMVIRLKPEHLGELTLRVSVSSEGAVTASFFTNNSEVRHIVENSLVQLRQELQNQGLKVDKAEVYAGLSDGNLPQGQGQEAWQQNQRGNFSRGDFRNQEADALSFEEISTETSTQNASNLADDRVDYLV